ncbi:MAG: heme exporter protein CcmD [Pseudomonadota bacterium]
MTMFDMGDYGPYVWTCFGLGLAVLVFNEWHARRRHKRLFRDVQVRVRAKEGEQ